MAARCCRKGVSKMPAQNINRVHDAACSSATHAACLARHIIEYNGKPDRQAHHRPIVHSYVRLLISSALTALSYLITDEDDYDRILLIEGELESIIKKHLPEECECEKEVAV